MWKLRQTMAKKIAKVTNRSWSAVDFSGAVFCSVLACQTLAENTQTAQAKVTELVGELSTESYDFQKMANRFPAFHGEMPITLFAAMTRNDRIRMAGIVQAFCDKVDARYRRFGWGTSPCLRLPWTFSRVTEQGNPLIYWEYSNIPTGTERSDIGTTLVLGGVHPDEITPVHVAFRFANALSLFPENYIGMRVVVAPLVNPDGFFVNRPTRTNANGVDLNRNFPTQDWWSRAQGHWQKKRNNDRRHFPGFFPGSEEGTRFQMDLMDRYEPDKVISIHAPLGFLDYDGPGDTWGKNQATTEVELRARELVFSMAKNSRNYKVQEFPIYPGSLGTYSGYERLIPTVTLELDSTDTRKVNQFWREFYPGLKAAIRFDFRSYYIAKLESPCQSIFCSLLPRETRQHGEVD